MEMSDELENRKKKKRKSCHQPSSPVNTPHYLCLSSLTLPTCSICIYSRRKLDRDLSFCICSGSKRLLKFLKLLKLRNVAGVTSCEHSMCTLCGLQLGLSVISTLISAGVMELAIPLAAHFSPGCVGG